MKKTFKKVLAWLMATGMTLSLCACGGDNGDSGDSGSSSSDTIEWSFYSAYGPEDGACCAVWQDLFDRIYEETDGRLQITTYWYGQHPYEGEEMLKVVSDGTAELTHFYSGYVESVDPALSVEALPLLMPVDAYEAYDILTALWGNFSGDTSGTLESILQEKWGATMVHCMPASPQRLFTAGYDAVEPNSLEGHKIRSYSTATAAFVQALGGTPVSISLSGDLYRPLYEPGRRPDHFHPDRLQQRRVRFHRRGECVGDFLLHRRHHVQSGGLKFPA